MTGIFRSNGGGIATNANRHQTLADHAYERIEHLIVTLAYLPGDEISESGVCAKLNIGRTPVREAILRLRHARLIEPGPGRSHIVTRIDYEESLQISEVARLLHTLMVERAAQSRTQLEARRFTAFADLFPRYAQAGDVEGYLHAHAAMYAQIAESGRQEVAARAMGPLTALARRLVVVQCVLHDFPLAAFAPCHAMIATAIAAGDDKAAVSALYRAMDRWVEMVEILAANAAPQDVTEMLREAAVGSG